jgi:hypothetical protein
MKLLKIAAATVASACLIFASGTAAEAYPVNTDTQIILSKTSAIRSGSTIKVKAKNVDKGCEVTFSVKDRTPDEEDYDIASAFAGNNYQTAYTALSVPEAPGEYYVLASYEDSCRPTAVEGHQVQTAAAFLVGKYTELARPVVSTTGLLVTSKKPTLSFTGTLKSRSTLPAGDSTRWTGVAGQKVSVVVTVTPPTGSPVALPAIVATTDSSGNYSGKLAITAKNLKGTYTMTASFTGDKVYTSSQSAATTGVSIASARAQAAAAKLAASLALATSKKLPL